MKKIFLFMVAATLSLAIGGCSSDDDVAPASTNIAVTATDTDFEAYGGEGTIYIDTNATTIEATTDADWLTITEAYSASKDGKAWVSFVVSENRSEVVRSATVTICTGARECKTTVTQQSAAMIVSDAVTEFTAAGGAGRMTVETTATGLEAASNVEWLKIGAIEDSIVNFTVDTNVSAQERTAEITLSLGSISRVITVKQTGAVLTIVESKLEFENGGGDGEILLETTFTEITVEEDAEWLTINIASPEKITYTVAPNTTADPRSATLKISAGEVSQTLTITQKSPAIDIVDARTEFEAVGGNGRVSIEATSSTITATTEADWLTIIQANPEAVYFNVKSYTEEQPRTATIQIVYGDVSKTVSVTQKGLTFEPVATMFTPDAKGGEFAFEYASNYPALVPTVTIPDTAPWLTVSVAEGKVNFTANPSVFAAREVVVPVTLGWKTVDVTVKQAVTDLLDITGWTVDNREQTVEVNTFCDLATIATAVSFSSSDSWFTATKTATGFSINFSANTTGTIRTGTLKIVGDNNQELTYSVRQTFTDYDYFLDGTWTLNYTDRKGVAQTTKNNLKFERHPDAALAAEGYYKVTGFTSVTKVWLNVKYVNGELTIPLGWDFGKMSNADNVGSGTVKMFAYQSGRDGWLLSTSGLYGFDLTLTGDSAAPSFTIAPNAYTAKYNSTAAATSVVTGIYTRFSSDDTTVAKSANWGIAHNIQSLVKNQ